jgi:hypothetical protein
VLRDGGKRGRSGPLSPYAPDCRTGSNSQERRFLRIYLSGSPRGRRPDFLRLPAARRSQTPSDAGSLAEATNILSYIGHRLGIKVSLVTGCWHKIGIYELGVQIPFLAILLTFLAILLIGVNMDWFIALTEDA